MAKILVVDDCFDVTFSYAMLLRGWGHETASATDVASALRLASEFRPDVALVDDWMPGGDGNEVARGLLRMPGLEHILLVSVTGYAAGEKDAPSADFDVVLRKPADPSQLRQV